MPKKPELRIVKRTDRPDRPWRLWIPAAMSPTGKRFNRSFPTREAAKAEKRRLELAHHTFGLEAGGADLEDLVLLKRAKEVLEPYGASLMDAVEFYTRAHSEQTISFADLIREYYETKSHLSERYTASMRVILPAVRDAMSDGISATAITPKILGDALKSLDLTPYEWNGHRRVISPVFTYAVHEGYCAENPVAKVPTKETPNREIQILTNGQARALIEAAQETKALPYFALGIFAGIRPAELDRLTLRDVDLRKRLVLVSHATSKTNRKRFVDVSDNLAALLEAHLGENSGVRVSRKLRERVRSVASVTLREAGEELDADSLEAWGHDIMRHTFASNHLAYHENLDKLALQMGHTTTKTSFEHYLHAIPKESAIEFWRIPDAAENRNLAIA